MKHMLRSALVGLLLVAVVLVGRRRLIVVTVEGRSMTPTLADGQRVIVLRVQPSRLQINDIVVFTVPRAAGHEGTLATAIKRITNIDGDGPDRRFYLTGDCADRSADSRHFGWVPGTHVIARLPRRRQLDRLRCAGNPWTGGR